MLRAALAGSYAANDIRSVFDHLLSVEGSFAPREPLHKELRLFVYQDAHCTPPAS